MSLLTLCKDPELKARISAFLIERRAKKVAVGEPQETSVHMDVS